MAFLNINKVVSITLQLSELAECKYIPELSGLEPEPDVGFPDMGQNLTRQNWIIPVCLSQAICSFGMLLHQNQNGLSQALKSLHPPYVV